MTSITIFYDSQCPLCVAEMRHLKRKDQSALIDLLDIHSPDFLDFSHGVSFEEANAVLHAVDANGKILKGLDVTYTAWTLVGSGFWAKPLVWQWLRPVLDWGYLQFARRRYRISGWLTGKKRCERCKI